MWGGKGPLAQAAPSRNLGPFKGCPTAGLGPIPQGPLHKELKLAAGHPSRNPGPAGS